MRSRHLALLLLLPALLAAATTAQAACPVTEWNLTAGQNTDVGSIAVSNDQDNIYVTYALDYPGATFGTLHLWVGTSLLSVPANSQGTPVPGQFPYSVDASDLTSYTFTVPMLGGPIAVDTDLRCGSTVYVVAHAEVDMDGIPGGDHETAFGGPIPGSGPRWWFYGAYQICCDFGVVTVPGCDTVYAKGGWVWTTDRKSNPERLPSLNLTKNRWGWAINLTAPGTTSYPIWGGAGLNNTANGFLAGTLTLDWDGTEVVVTYDIAVNYLHEVHVYAGDAPPATIAPGQYGSTGYLDPGANGPGAYSVTLPLADTDGTGGVWVVGHGVVCDNP